jgi:hypothetical protein
MCFWPHVFLRTLAEMCRFKITNETKEQQPPETKEQQPPETTPDEVHRVFWPIFFRHFPVLEPFWMCLC